MTTRGVPVACRGKKLSTTTTASIFHAMSAAELETEIDLSAVHGELVDIEKVLGEAKKEAQRLFWWSWG